MQVYNTNEVYLFGYRFKLTSPVRRQIATPFAQKLTIGDYSRDSQVIESSWVLSTFSGGLGVTNANVNLGSDRFNIATLQTLYPNQLTLNDLVTKASVNGPADTIIDYNERLYWTVGTTVYLWDEDTHTGSAIGSGLPSTALDVCVFNGNLFFITSAGLVEYNATTSAWTTYTDATGVAVVSWDDKLFRMTATNSILWTIDPATNQYDSDGDFLPDTPWTPGGKVPLPAGYVKQLITYFDVTGESVIYAVTRNGTWAYNFDAAKFYQTALRYPVVVSSGEGSDVWRGELYVPVENEAYKFNNSTVEAVGPNKDDGLPSEMRGSFNQIIPGHAFYYLALTKAQDVAITDPYDPITPILDSEIGDETVEAFFDHTQSFGSILVSPGTAWHVLYVDPFVGSGMGASIVADIQGTHRLWFSSGSGLYYAESPTSLHNPLQNPSKEFAPDGYLITSWFDSGWAELKKLALTLEVNAKQITSTEKIDISIAWDGSENWEHVGSITTNGRSKFYLGGDTGRLFYQTRLRFTMSRNAADATKTPVLISAVLGFTRQPKKVWGWEFDIDLSTDFHGLTPTDQRNALLELSGGDIAGIMSYKDSNGTDQRYRVLVTTVAAAEHTGLEDGGRFTVSVVETDYP